MGAGVIVVDAWEMCEFLDVRGRICACGSEANWSGDVVASLVSGIESPKPAPMIGDSHVSTWLGEFSTIPLSTGSFELILEVDF